jgi:TPR repeat protein
MYILGEGTAPDVEKGLTWLRLSAEHGHQGAMRLLSDLYRHAFHGVPREEREADAWDQRLRQLQGTPEDS